MDELNAEFIIIIENIKNDIANTEQLYEKLNLIFTKDNYLKYLDDIVEYIKDLKKNMTNIKTTSSAYNIKIIFANIHETYSIINKIKKTFKLIYKTIHKSNKANVTLSQTYIGDILDLYKKIYNFKELHYEENIKTLDKIIEKTILYEMTYVEKLEEAAIINYILDIQNIFLQNFYSTDLFLKLISNIINFCNVKYPENRQIIFNVKNLLEHTKNNILNKDLSKISKSKYESNPNFKRYGLIPITDPMPIHDISKTIFADSSITTIKQFIQLSKSKNYGVLIINKQISDPIVYNLMNLFDWNESSKFAKIHNKIYGPNKYILNRFETIKTPLREQEKSIKNKWDFKIEHYNINFKEDDVNNKDWVIILECLSINLYRVLGTFFKRKVFFTRISSITELYNDIKGFPKIQTRCANLNNMYIKKAIPNIFCPIKPNLEKVKNVASVADPKYLKNKLQITIIEKFNTLSKKIKSYTNFTYGELIHNEELLNTFSDTIIQEFYEYLYKTFDEYLHDYINISDIITSFLNTLYIYQRTFVKELHDYFKSNLLNTDHVITYEYISNHFQKMVGHVLNKIITDNSNIYYSVLYKINLLKTTFV